MKRGSRRVKKKRVQPRKRQLFAGAIQNLRSLAEQIGRIVPATSYRAGFSFQKIARRHGLSKYWPKQGNKKDLIFGFLKDVYRSHPKYFYKIFRENIAQGIERRHGLGDPVLEAEILELDATLRELGVNLSKEFRTLHLPKERPRIVPPPPAFQRMVDEIGLHPLMQPECPQLFKNGHLNEAARKALEKYEVFVRGKAAIATTGKDLMAAAFSETSPAIRITDIATKSGKGLQDGFKFLSMGAMAFWRNMFSHGDEAQIGHQDAIAILATVSHFLYYIEQNQII